MNICEQRGVEYFIVAKQHRNLMNAVREIPDSAWQPFAVRELPNLKRKIALRRKPDSRFKGAPEIAGMMFKPRSWSKARRYVIKRTPIVDKDEKHWHGATADGPMTHIAINLGESTEWLEPVAPA